MSDVAKQIVFVGMLLSLNLTAFALQAPDWIKPNDVEALQSLKTEIIDNSKSYSVDIYSDRVIFKKTTEKTEVTYDIESPANVEEFKAILKFVTIEKKVHNAPFNREKGNAESSGFPLQPTDVGPLNGDTDKLHKLKVDILDNPNDYLALVHPNKIFIRKIQGQKSMTYTIEGPGNVAEFRDLLVDHATNKKRVYTVASDHNIDRMCLKSRRGSTGMKTYTGCTEKQLVEIRFQELLPSNKAAANAIENYSLGIDQQANGATN